MIKRKFGWLKNNKKKMKQENMPQENITKYVTKDDTQQIGNHSSCKRCVLLPNDEVRKNHLRNEAEEAGYQAYMDYARGSLTPEEAYTNRGFVKDKYGKWMYGKLLEKDNAPYNSHEELHPTIFKMITKEGQTHSFTYLGQNRYSPNRSSTCGYGSDDWLYLCEENNTYYLLIFTDNASFGTDWMCVELLEDDYEKLVTKDINFWGSIAYSRERNKTYGMHLTDVNSVRHLLPTVSRCCGKLTDEHFLA